MKLVNAKGDLTADPRGKCPLRLLKFQSIGENTFTSPMHDAVRNKETKFNLLHLHQEVCIQS